MKRFLYLAALGLISLGATSAIAQNRDLGARRLLLDNGAGDILTIEYPGPGSATLQIPPGGGAIPAGGSVTNATLRWDGTNWVENTGVLATASGLTLNTGGSLDLTISEEGISRSGDVMISTGAVNSIVTDGNLVVDASTSSYLSPKYAVDFQNVPLDGATGLTYFDESHVLRSGMHMRSQLGSYHGLQVYGKNGGTIPAFVDGLSGNGNLNALETFASDPAHTPLAVTGTPTQTVDLQTWSRGSGNVVALVDANGNFFSTGDGSFSDDVLVSDNLTVNGAVMLPATTSTDGYLSIAGNRFLHNFNGTFVGSNSGNVTNTGASNTALGTFTLVSLTSGAANTAVGHHAMIYNTTGFENTGVGTEALFYNSTGSYNTALGTASLQLNTTGSQNAAVGVGALQYNTIGTDNTATGNFSLRANTTGSHNAAFGKQALESNTTGTFNAALGAFALQLNTTGGHNTAVGTLALQYSTTGFQNTAVGLSSLRDNTTGSWNAAVGVDALENNTTGSQNTALGRGALYNNTTGVDNTAIGNQSLLGNISGSQNTAIGMHANVNADNRVNATAIGYGALATADHQVVLGNGSVTQVVTSGVVTAPAATLSALNVSTAPGDKFAGLITTDDASADGVETFSHSLATTNSIVMATLNTNLGATEIVNAVPGAGTITITFSANVADGAKVSYLIINP